MRTAPQDLGKSRARGILDSRLARGRARRRGPARDTRERGNHAGVCRYVIGSGEIVEDGDELWPLSRVCCCALLARCEVRMLPGDTQCVDGGLFIFLADIVDLSRDYRG